MPEFLLLGLVLILLLGAYWSMVVFPRQRAFQVRQKFARSLDVVGLADAQPGARDQRLTRRSAPPRRIQPLFDAAGNAVFVGRSGAQNDEVTFTIAGPNDTWLHARGVPGSHVVIRWRNPGSDDRPETIQAAAQLAAFYSSGRDGGLAEVEESDSAYLIRGFSCPFAAASPDHPAVCQMAAAFLTEYVGAPVEACCRPSEANGAPRCVFEIPRENAEELHHETESVRH